MHKVRSAPMFVGPVQKLAAVYSGAGDIIARYTRVVWTGTEAPANTARAYELIRTESLNISKEPFCPAIIAVAGRWQMSAR